MFCIIMSRQITNRSVVIFYNFPKVVLCDNIKKMELKNEKSNSYCY